mmetsp:Transcript_10311/g.41720  ORF Transcript_10311/g.41720 Transcript_10311/m.41720 type:complete len:200 (+) Transcript_10311:716-1315(+)
MDAAVSASTRRGDVGAKMTPMRSAPFRAAVSASSTVVTPHTLASHRVVSSVWRETASSSSVTIPSSRLAARRLSGARMSASPTRTESMLADCAHRSRTSCRAATPDSDARTGRGPPMSRTKSATTSASLRVASMSSAKVWRLRLLTPTTRAPDSNESRISTSVCASTIGSRPSARLSLTNSWSCDFARHAAMSNTASAP